MCLPAAVYHTRPCPTAHSATFRGPFFPEQVAVAASVCRHAQERAMADGGAERGPPLLALSATASDEYARVREGAARVRRGTLHAPDGGDRDGAVLNRALLTTDPSGGDAWLLSRERRGL